MKKELISVTAVSKIEEAIAGSYPSFCIITGIEAPHREARKNVKITEINITSLKW